jgi:protein tyrosine/serine phosphatase
MNRAIVRDIMRKLALSLCVLFVAACSADASTDDDTAQTDEAVTAAAPITNFHVVRSGRLYRGARPGDAGLAYLKKIGVKTIVDLETTGLFEPTSDSDIANEKAEAAKLGLVFRAEPMSSYLPVSNSRVNEVMSILADPKAAPVYVHCAHGQDRTGLIIGLERVEDQSWPPQRAYDEMKADGFHPILENLNHYFEERTGFED